MIRSFFFGLGVLLGFVTPQTAPELAARVYRVGNEVFLNAELEGAFPDGALELAASGTVVAFELEARIEGGDRTALARRSLSYELGRGEWVVGFGEGGDMKRMVNREAALALAGRVWSLRLGAFPGGGSSASVVVRARSGIVDETGAWHDAGILWGYAEPLRRFRFESAVEIPR